MVRRYKSSTSTIIPWRGTHVVTNDGSPLVRTRGKPLPPDSSLAEALTTHVPPAPRQTQNDASAVAPAQPTTACNAEAEPKAAAAADYPIGYKKPPKATQFKPGQSGNPRGRVKGSRNTRSIFEEESQKLVPVTENGKTQKLTKRELVLKTIINKAARGDEKAQVKFLKLDERFSASTGKPGGTGEPSSASSETLAELTTADRIILERYRSLATSPSSDDEAPVLGRTADPSSVRAAHGDQ